MPYAFYILVDNEFKSLIGAFHHGSVLLSLHKCNYKYFTLKNRFIYRKYLREISETCTEDKYSCFQKETLNWKCKKPHSTLFWFVFGQITALKYCILE